MRFYLSLYLLIAAVYLLTASGRLGLSDGFAMFNVSQSVVTDRSFSSEPCEPVYEGHPNCVPGKDGRYYAGYGLVPSLLAAPVVLAGKLVSMVLHVSSSQVAPVLVSLFTALLAPLTCVVLAMWIIELGYSNRTAVLGACILAFASPYWQFGVKGFYSEPYFTLFLLLAAYLLSSRKVPLTAGLSGLAFGVACGCRINGLIMFPAFVVSIALHVRALGWNMSRFLRDALFFSGSFSVCAILIGWANYARFGSLLKTGYHLNYPTASALLSTPLLHGIWELLFNGEIGLLIFAPWLFVALIGFSLFTRNHLPEAVLCATIFVFNFIFFAKHCSLDGGWVAGPRFLVPTLPFMVIATVAAVERNQRAGAFRGKALTVLRSLATILLTGAFLTQILLVIYPVGRYYHLKDFYGHWTVKPWWIGSIPLASIDFLGRVTATKVKPSELIESTDSDPLRRLHEMQRAYASMDSAIDEESFLSTFPNPENNFLPNLMLWKIRSFGLSAFAFYSYVVFAVIMFMAGLVGLKRYSVPVQQ
jgi:hypothetical protein